MQDAVQEQVSPQPRPIGNTGAGWQIPWFLLHVAVVYALVNFWTARLAGWTRGWLLPVLQRPTSSSSFQFLFSHIFAFSFIPAFLIGLVNARWRHKVAHFVWVVPAVILAYKFVTFPAPSVLQSHSHFSAAFHQYFGGAFVIREFSDWEDLWSLVGGNADMSRGMAQLKFTAPFYAGVGYSVGAWISFRTELLRKIVEKVKTWERSRFSPDQ
jgi:hypothetical protein